MRTGWSWKKPGGSTPVIPPKPEIDVTWPNT